MAQLPEPVLARLQVEVSAPRHRDDVGASPTLAALLERDGYAVVRQVLRPEEFEAMCAGLGTPGFETLVALREDIQTYLCRPEPVPLHTDHPEARYIAWHCLRQDEQDGAVLLVDAHKLLASGPDELSRALEQVRLPTGWGPQPRGTRAVVTRSSDMLQVFYAPWLQPVALSLEANVALKDFGVRVENAFNAPTVEVRLEPGQVLIVDNHRILHGRRALDGASSRMLRRLWIRVGRGAG